MSDPEAPPATALLSFTARNVRSYWEEVSLSLLGTRLSDRDVVRGLAIAGTAGPVSVLPVAGIFGANASGKSTILRAMADMRTVVLGSFRQGDRESQLYRHPFLLREPGTEHPSRFAVDLILNGVRWQYGFEIDDHRVLDEYAYYYPKGRQALVFRRERGDELPRFGPLFRSSGRALARLVRKNSLLLSVAGAAADGADETLPGFATLIGRLFAWFRNNLLLMDSNNREVRLLHTADRAHAANSKNGVLSLLRAADLGITGMERVPVDPEFAERMQRALRVLEGHEADTDAEPDDSPTMNDLVRLNHEGAAGPIPIDPEHESQGTRVWVSLIGPILDALSRGTTVLVDELDSSLHPHLVKRIIWLFQNRKSNSRCAQLVFNAHDPTILGDSGRRVVGRDQIWFTEKNAQGASTLLSLADFGPKRDEALGRRYLQGRYGGVPLLDSVEFEEATDPTR